MDSPSFPSLSARAEQIGTQKTGTATKDQVLQIFRTIIRQREGRVRDKVGEGSTIYNEVSRTAASVIIPA